MSTPHVVDDELVEALAREFCARRPMTRSHGASGYPCEACTLDARDFIAKHIPGQPIEVSKEGGEG